MNPTVKNIQHMLRESNAIEDVRDKASLTYAHRAWKYLMQYDTLNTQIIKHAHSILMTNQDIAGKYKGAWRDVPVTIGGQTKSQSKIVIDSLMRDFCSHVNEIKKTDSKNHDAIHCHLDFENIHPFIDGNGRMGRILLNWQLVKMGMPLLVYTEADKKTYYRLFSSYRSSEMNDMFKRMREDWKRIHDDDNIATS